MSTGQREPALIGQLVLGRYRVLRRLAQGGMGAVYLGRIEGAKGFTRPVVIKRILPSLVDDEDTSRMFVREARLLSMLQDPGIVSVVDFGHESGGGLVMVLDYVHGYHLGYWLRYLTKVRAHMPAEMALHIAIKVLDALHHAHTFKRPDGRELQIIHRDVSPANILLDVNGNVKLVDFGIARALGDADEYHTETPRLKGKFGYLPPESFLGEDPTVQADIYASGVVLYELLTGDNPFRGKEITDTYHKVLNLTPAPVESLRADLPKGIDVPLTRALAKNPLERFPTALEFATALRALRSTPDEVAHALLRTEVQKAFEGPLAEVLGIEPLSARDAAWREASDSEQSLQAASSAPPPVGLYEPPTRIIEKPSPEAPDKGLTKNLAGRKPAAVDPIATEHKKKTLPRAWTYVALLSALLLATAALVLGLLLGRDRSPVGRDAVVVIERERNAAPPEASSPTRQDSTTEPAPQPTTTSSPAHEDAKTAKRERAEPAAAPAPDPKLLTRAFSKQQQRVQDCFSAHADAIDAQPDLAFEFHVGASGAVEQAELKPDAIGKTALGTCLLGVAKNTHFPRLKEAVSFRIPIKARRVLAQ